MAGHPSEMPNFRQKIVFPPIIANCYEKWSPNLVVAPSYFFLILHMLQFCNELDCRMSLFKSKLIEDMVQSSIKAQDIPT